MEPPEVPPADEIPCDPPRVLWIELTSRCPFECIFCSRKTLRGAGRHMDFGLCRRILDQLRNPEVIRLNYSGESIHYPRLAEAIELAHATGARTELVSALASAPEHLLEALVTRGLDRLTVSLHTTASNQFEEIYRYSSLDNLRAKLALLLRLREERRTAKPSLDFAFVAMRRNLDQLLPIAEFARECGVREIRVFPVIRRDEIPHRFDQELEDGRLRTSFQREILETVERVRQLCPDVQFGVTPAETLDEPALGPQPQPYSGALPPGGRIYSCEQNPWETAHILANGDVVVCEVQDKVSMGNLNDVPLEQIWHGPKYSAFRRRYADGEDPVCCRCPYKIAYAPSAMRCCVEAGDGMSFQLARGWHLPAHEDAIWSKWHCCMVLKGNGFGAKLQIRGILPPARDASSNTLSLRAGGRFLGSIRNPSGDMLAFDSTFTLPGDAGTVTIECSTSSVCRPAEQGASRDERELGFALIRVAVEKKESRWLRWALYAADFLVPFARRLRPFRRRLSAAWSPGISIVIPERGSPEMLRECLSGVRAAAGQALEPVEILVVVNGAPLLQYREVAREFPETIWLTSPRPLSFAQAVRRGVRRARYDWVFLLNSDAVPEPDALAQLLPWRGPHVFAVASRIVLPGASAHPEETGWTDFRQVRGEVEIFDVAPEDEETVRGSLYAGGGASLFRKALLRRFLARRDPYAPFYWEDVEWGVRAWRAGYEVLFAPKSRVRHRRRATVSRYYKDHEIDRIFRRNQIQFMLRNRFDDGDAHRLLAGLVKEDPTTQAAILKPGNCLRLLWARVRTSAARNANFCFPYVRRKFYPTPFQSLPEGRAILVASPYAVFPPAHGGAVRLARLLEHLKRQRKIVLLSDEESCYQEQALPYFAGLAAVHLVGGRREMCEQRADRIGRILSHSHDILKREATRLAESYSVGAVQVEFVELAKLVEAREGAAPWFLTLHEVLLESGGRPEEDSFEKEWIARYDAAIVCSPEDAALLHHREVLVAPNGVEMRGDVYVPSRGRRTIAFLGPFRYRPNWDGIQRFLTCVYPRLLRTLPGVGIDVFGGLGALERAAGVDCFRQPGVRVHDHVEDVRRRLDACAVTINPLDQTRGSCLKVIESLAAGRVCVSTVAGARGFLRDGFRSLVAVPRVGDFLEPLGLLLSEEDRRLELEPPQAELLDRYRWEHAARKQLDLYRRYREASQQAPMWRSLYRLLKNPLDGSATYPASGAVVDRKL
ncbi:MAG TPA: glycosyltransferase [Bryobacteraceae bacterium]|nr:glycosyltransferase [Bryobacteraceae bacterium]